MSVCTYLAVVQLVQPSTAAEQAAGSAEGWVLLAAAEHFGTTAGKKEIQLSKSILFFKIIYILRQINHITKT